MKIRNLTQNLKVQSLLTNGVLAVRLSKGEVLPLQFTAPCVLLAMLVFAQCIPDDVSGPVGNGVPPGGARTAITTPQAGTLSSAYPVPAEAAAEDVSNPTTVVGTGTPASCTPEALEHAIHQGGIVTFNGGPDPVTITFDHEIQIYNDSGVNHNGDVLIDGGGKITLSGGGRCRIIYQDGCDQSLHWITSHCDNYPHPRLVVQNLIFADGFTSDPSHGGGALYVRSGILKVVNCVFVNNRCAMIGPDVGGAAIYAIQQSGQVYIVNSTFGGDSLMGNIGSNGGALGSIGVSYTLINCVMSWNRAVGYGMNPAQQGTPGGGSGGAIYNDGNTYMLTIDGCDINHNTATELAGAVFYVSNDLSGSLVVDQSTCSANTESIVQKIKGFFVLAKDTIITNSTIN